MSFLGCLAPRGESWCAGIWFGTLPHYLITPLAPKETEFLQPLLSVYQLPFFFSPLGFWSGGCPSITTPEWMSRDALFRPHRRRKKKKKSDETGGSFVPFLKSSQHRIGIVLFCISGEKKVVFNLWLADIIRCDLIWWSSSLSAILYLCLPYSCLRYNRQFFIPVSLHGEKKKKKKNLCSGLILLMLKSDYGL